ncbi:MAG: protein translocase subunit SecD [Candidatus Hydrogenedentota bacterium]
MDRGLQIRIGICFIIIIISLWFLYPTTRYYFLYSAKERENFTLEKEISLKKNTISLGLDLQGGMHLVLEVDVERVRQDIISYDIDRLRSQAFDKGCDFEYEIKEASKVLIKMRHPGMLGKFKKEVDLKDAVFDIETEISENELLLSINEDKFQKVIEETTERALVIVRNRVDQFGVSEPVIRPMGKNRIIVELAGIRDPRRAKNLIQNTALLEFYLASDDENLKKQAEAGRTPPGYRYEEIVEQRAGREFKEKVLIYDRPAMTAKDLKDARVVFDNFGKPIVSFEFGGEGADKFFDLTSNNIDKQLAIVLDNKVVSAPTIRAGIRERGIIEGNFTEEEAKDLAIKLRAGALPAPMKISEERSIGPSLGQDSIKKGILALEVAAILIFIFMVVRYKWSGMLANAALVLNIVLIFAGLAYFNATLTLPGLAGIILTVGMAVDANVLINERIKEELIKKKTLKGSIDAGYDMAFNAIFDSNLTTVIAAAILYQFGTGPIKGFAVTLSIGIISNMITAIYITRTVYIWMLQTNRMQRISI